MKIHSGTRVDVAAASAAAAADTVGCIESNLLAQELAGWGISAQIDSQCSKCLLQIGNLIPKSSYL